jgi:thioredoxin 1
LEELAREYEGRVKFALMDMDQNKVIASKEGITGVPALFFYRNGSLSSHSMGFLGRPEIVRRLNNLLS